MLIKKSQVCAVCKDEKPMSEFYSDKSNSHGKQYRCIECDKKRLIKYYRNPLKRIMALATKKKYGQTRKGKDVWKRASLKALKNHPERWEARYKTRRAIAKGELIKLPCQICGNSLSEAHHEDYSKPLEVIWLCKEHHRVADKLKLILTSPHKQEDKK